MGGRAGGCRPNMAGGKGSGDKGIENLHHIRNAVVEMVDKEWVFDRKTMGIVRAIRWFSCHD